MPWPGHDLFHQLDSSGLEEEPAEAKTKKADHLSKTEETILSYILASGFTSREEIAQKCGEQGIEIAARSVSRCLKILTEKGMLRREGKKYLSTDLAKDKDRQETL